MTSTFEPRLLGRTGQRMMPLGLGASFGLSADDIEYAVDRGVRYLYWGTLRRPGFGAGIRRVCRRRRDDLFVVIQSYARLGTAVEISLRTALFRLGLEYADLLLLGLHNSSPWDWITEKAVSLRDRGLTRFIGVSTHHRPYARGLLEEDNSPFDVIHIRYNAAHRGAEREIFPRLKRGEPSDQSPALVCFTATRWGSLLDRQEEMPESLPTPRASDCYRFCLARPEVSLVIAGPGNSSQLEEALATLDRGPMSEDEIAWMRQVGDYVYEAHAS